MNNAKIPSTIIIVIMQNSCFPKLLILKVNIQSTNNVSLLCSGVSPVTFLFKLCYAKLYSVSCLLVYSVVAKDMLRILFYGCHKD